MIFHPAFTNLAECIADHKKCVVDLKNDTVQFRTTFHLIEFTNGDLFFDAQDDLKKFVKKLGVDPTFMDDKVYYSMVKNLLCHTLEMYVRMGHRKEGRVFNDENIDEVLEMIRDQRD